MHAGFSLNTLPFQEPPVSFLPLFAFMIAVQCFRVTLVNAHRLEVRCYGVDSYGDTVVRIGCADEEKI